MLDPDCQRVSATPAFKHVYHLGLGRLLVLPLLWLPVFLLLVGMSLAEPEQGEAFLLTALVFTLIVLPFAWVTWHSRLVLTEDGIAHHQLGYTVRSSWSNLQSLSLEPRCEALYLTEPGTKSRLLRWSSQLLGSGAPGAMRSVIGDPRALAEGRLIFLAPFIVHYRRGPLRHDLVRAAPQLFDAEGKPRRP